MEDYEIELELTKLMQELQKVSIELETTTSPLVFLIENISKNIEEVSKPFSEKSAILQNRIKELALIRAKSLKTGSGNITYRKPSVRRSWDLDMLDEACEVDESVKARIWHYRKESISEPQILIKVETKGKSVTDI